MPIRAPTRAYSAKHGRQNATLVLGNTKARQGSGTRHEQAVRDGLNNRGPRPQMGKNMSHHERLNAEGSSRLDAKALKAERPEIYDRYAVTSTSKRFTVT